jgi:hypothetical protein
MPLDEQDKQWIDAQLNARLEQAEGRLNARLEQMETRLLTAFYKWASPNEKRQRSHGLRIGAVEEELADVQERIKKLEGGGQ